MNLNFSLLEWQQKVFDDDTRFKVIVAGRRCGKSRFAIVQTIVKALQCNRKDASVLYVAPTYQMVKVLAWDALTHLAEEVIESSNINDGRIKLINGVSIYTRGADNPDSLRGMKLAYAVIDEAKDIKPEVFERIIRPALSDLKGGALFIGTPEPGESLFRTYYERGLEPGEGIEWRSWHFTTSDNELIDKKEIEAAKNTMSTMEFEREYMASFESMSQEIFKTEWLKYGKEPDEGSYYIAVDPAGFEAVQNQKQKQHLDNSAIAVIKVTDDGRWWVKKIEYGRWDVRETATRILKNVKDTRPLMVGIEKGSLMRALLPYLTDQMHKYGQYAHIEPIGIAKGKTDRITYNLQGLFEHGRISLNDRENWDQFKKEYMNFPARGTHDDLIDSLSLCANLVTTSYSRYEDEPEEIISEICGF